MIQSLHIDRKGNKSIIHSGPFWPKNTQWGLRRWVKAYTSYVLNYIEQYGKPDVIHAHTYLGAMVAAELQKCQLLPFIVTEHYSGWMDGSIRSHHRLMGLSAMRSAMKVITVSKALKSVLQPSLAQEIEVLPNFIDYKIFKKDIKKKSSAFEILGVGDLIPRKQWDHLIKVFAAFNKEHRNSKLTIIGDGSLRADLMTQIRDLNLEASISLPGRYSKTEVAKAMQRSSVLVHTSHTETFGLIYLEALACGLPVISYANGGVNEFQDYEKIQIVEKNNQEALKEAITQFANLSDSNNSEIADLKIDETPRRYKSIYSSVLKH